MTTDVFKFMSLRSPNSIEESEVKAKYIKDDYWKLDNATDFQPVKIRKEKRALGCKATINKQTDSTFGSYIFRELFCNPQNQIKTEIEINQIILNAIVTTFNIEINCAKPEVPYLNFIEDYCFSFKDINDKDKYCYFPIVFILSEEWYLQLQKVSKTIKKNIEQTSFNKSDLLKDVGNILGKPIEEYVFATPKYSANNIKDISSLNDYLHTIYSTNFSDAKSSLFEILYTSYILRRITKVDLDPIIEALRVLHTLEWLVIDGYLENNGNITDDSIKVFLEYIINEMHLDSILINNAADLNVYYTAMPIIHPIFARLAWYKKPFNEIKPIGIGDLKVVKQTLLGYELGEICNIHNVMAGEAYEKIHERLDKTEDTFSFSSEQNNSNEMENQTTDKNEIKREADNVIKNDLQANANASFTYNGPIVANLTAGMSYHTSSEDSQKLSSNFARDVMDKAVSKVENKVSQQRSNTKISQVTETNKHTMTGGTEHTSGIFRWVDKKYMSQVYNYGKRLMYEFIIPEPAAFYIQSKLKAYEMFDLDMPQLPKKPVYLGNQMGFEPKNIDIDNFSILCKSYDLSEFIYPQLTKAIMCIDEKTGDSVFKNRYLDQYNNNWMSDHFEFKIEDKGYRITALSVFGQARFWDEFLETPPTNDKPFTKNSFLLKINGLNVEEREFGSNPVTFAGLAPLITLPSFLTLGKDVLDPLNQTVSLRKDYGVVELKGRTFDITDGNISIDLSFQDVDYYNVSFQLYLTLDPQYLLNWQTKIYNKIKSIEQSKVDKINQDLKAAYDSQIIDYNNKLTALQGQKINDLIQGKSEAFNRDIILKELKKHCLTILTKEFDSEGGDDILSGLDSMVNSSVKNVMFQKFEIKDNTAAENDDKTSSSNGSLSLPPLPGTPGYVPPPPTKTPPPPSSTTTPPPGNTAPPPPLPAIPKTEDGTDGNFKSTYNSVIATYKLNVDYPSIHLDKAKLKGSYIQFLEQAFEWQQLAYIFYPYFWASQNKWINLMNYNDYTDKNFSDFLQAGSVRVLLAVQPSYNDAVIHYLATREPWNGGTVPVIGDPLYLPLFEEIHKKQDDLYGAKSDGSGPWYFTVPTSLVWLQGSQNEIPNDLKVPSVFTPRA